VVLVGTSTPISLNILSCPAANIGTRGVPATQLRWTAVGSSADATIKWRFRLSAGMLVTYSPARHLLSLPKHFSVVSLGCPECEPVQSSCCPSFLPPGH
jgi:hypothetical protein